MLKTFVHRPNKVLAICYSIDTPLAEFRSILDGFGVRNYQAGKLPDESLPRLNLILDEKRPTRLKEGDWVVVHDAGNGKVEVLEPAKFNQAFAASQT